VKEAAKPTMPIYDVLPTETELPVWLKPGLAAGDLSAEDMKGICSALGRTPGVRYEIQALTCFPANDIPMAVRVKVDGFLLFMCRGRDDQWHVFRTAKFVVDSISTTEESR